ncbi:MAG: PKD domain-containing protein [Planctomycetes bacterium]|nr:PKD domain-containing protein [Planctomycetota bacterium]
MGNPKYRARLALAGVATLMVILAACGGGGKKSGGGSSGGGTGPTPVAPVADFSGTPTTLQTGQSVTFTDLSTGTPVTWAWDFDGNGTTDSTAQNPAHVYNTAGTFNVTLAVTNAFSADSVTKTTYVTVTAPPTGTVDIDVDSNRDGTVSAGADDDTNEHVWSATQGAVFYYNLDDDNNDNVEDYKDTTASGADLNDLARIIVRQMSGAAGGTVTVLVSASAQNRVRIFQNSGGTWTSVYSSGASFTIPAANVVAGDVELGMEARDRMSATWNGHCTLTLEVRNSGGTVLGTDTVILRVAPPIMATNLWPATEYHLVNIASGSTQNGAMRTAMQNICTAGGFLYREAAGTSYSGDRWLQDSSEPAVVQLPSSTGPRRVVNHVMQLARWRQVDQWCKNVLFDPEFDFFERFSTNSNSHNYGGNFEVVPPFTGKPYGKVAFGGGTGTLLGTTTSVTSAMTQVYKDFFDAAALQGPHLQYTSEWLAVGHIDEFSMFIPAPNTARGWVCLMASPDVAIQILQNVQAAGGGANAVMAGRSGYATTVNGILNDSALMTLQSQAQARINTARNQIKAATNLTDADFIHIPQLFEYVSGNYVAALNPGSVNLMVLPSANGTTYFAIPDPEGPDLSGADQFQADISAKLQGLTNGSNPFNITYVDVFWSYHDLLGELHCGSNTVRTPPNDDWWNK